MAKILSDKEINNALISIFGVSRHTVLDALNGKTKSDLANRIRKRALDMGCKTKGSEVIKTL